jgi:hypothetical protein
VPKVRNLSTNLVWDVPEGHFSLTSAGYEIVREPAAAPVAAKKPAVKRPARAKK